MRRVLVPLAAFSVVVRSQFMPTIVRFVFVVIAVAAGALAHAEPQTLFETNCALCHQKGAAGVRGQFPRLAGRIGVIASTPAGRNYLQQVVLFGMAGKVDIDGAPLAGVMPPFASLSDEDLASILNYLTQLEAPGAAPHKVTAFTSAELAKTRGSTALSPTQVNANRAAAVQLRP
jgi:mono/diheme cytochrome c family protein